MVDFGGCGDELEDPVGPITAFDAAAYIYQLVGELAHMARGAALLELGGLLEAARERAAEDIIAAGSHAGSARASGDAA